MPAQRRLLIISTTFYPDPMVAGLRITQWSKYLPPLGWQPTILCRHYGFEATPELLAKNVHPDVRVEYLTPPPVQSSTQATRSSMRSTFRAWAARAAELFLVPDSSARFWRSIRGKVLDIVKREKPDLILTTSPPHANHDIGLWLSTQTSIPWIADFRDPFIIDSRFQPTGLRRLNWPRYRAYERSIYERAALVTHAIPVQARFATRKYPFARNRIRTLTNGCPLELAEGLVPPLRSTKGRRTIRTVGGIAPNDCVHLARAVAQLVSKGQDLELSLVGNPPDTENAIREILSDRLVISGYLPHEQALQMMVGADVLVSYHDPRRAGTLQLTSKLFEFFATGNPVVQINPTFPDMHLLRKIPGVKVLRLPGVDQLTTAIENALNQPPQDPAWLANYRATFNRKSQTAQLATWFDELLAAHPRAKS